MMKWTIPFLTLIIISSFTLQAQKSNFIYGFGLQLEVDFGFVAKTPTSLFSQDAFGQEIKIARRKNSYPGVALSGSIGLGYNHKVAFKEPTKFLITSLYHVGFRLSRGQGMLGNSGSYNEQKNAEFELLNSFHFVFGNGKNKAEKEFQYFTSNHKNSLYVSQKNYLSLGTVIIQNAKRSLQRSGSIGISVENFSLFYTNDGGPVHGHLSLGDKWDRYWNGGIAVYYGNIDMYKTMGRLVLSYDRFTGYSKNAYKYGRVLKTDYVMYKDESEMAYNKGVWKIRYNNFPTGLGGYFAVHDLKRLDIQHLLHRKLKAPFHPNYLNYSYHFGGSYLNTIRE